MRKLSPVAVWALIVGLGVAAAGCGQFNMLKAKMNFKDANAAYQAQDYRRAVEKYTATIDSDPSITVAYFYLGNSYDNLYLARGAANGDDLIANAVVNYKKAAELEQNPQMKKLALEYLVAAYGSDKLNDPSQAEPVLQQIIALAPDEPTYYFQLSKIYEENGDYENAEQALNKAREVKPADPAVYMQLAGYHNRQGDFEKTIEALNQRVAQEPNNPEAYYTISTYYWDKAYRDFKLTDAEKRKYVQAGVDNVDKALGLRPDYVEALAYKNLLLRLQANLEPNAARQQALLKEADKLRDQAESLRKTKAQG